MSKRLEPYWQAEALRLREEHWGPLDDTEANRHARASAEGLVPRLLTRATMLAEQQGLSQAISQWRRGSRLALLLAGLLMLLAGASAAWAALGDGQRVVNLPWALASLLGLQVITLLIWLASLALPIGERPWLGRIWLWASRRLARSPDSALAPQAWTSLMQRQGALKPTLGALAHGLWLLLLASAAITMLVLLSTRRYTFAWETTLLDPQVFVTLAQAIGALPALLGFPVPDGSAILASDGLQAADPQIQAAWSGWLLGALTAYGLLPRAIALLACLTWRWLALRRPTLDLSLPGYLGLRDRLLATHTVLAPDAPAPAPDAPAQAAPSAMPDTGSHAALLAAVEMPGDIGWPPALPAGVDYAGNLDTRDQREALAERLLRQPPARLLLACDARQTPDRSTLRLLASLLPLAGESRVWLYGASRAPKARLEAWHTALAALRPDGAPVLAESPTPLTWLEPRQEPRRARNA